MTVRMRAMLLVIMLMLFLSVIFLLAGNYFNAKYLDYSFRRFDNQLSRSFAHSLELTDKKYTDAAYSIMLEPSVITAFSENDREGLLLRMMPVYKEMRDNEPFFRAMQFVDKHGRTLLRMHRPDLYGDDTTETSRLIKFVNENGRQISGFEAADGEIQYRVITPVYVDGRYQGMLSMGLDAGFIVDLVAGNFMFSSALLIDKAFAQKLGRDSSMRLAGEYYLAGSSDTVTETIAADFSPKRSVSLKKIDGVYYSLHKAYELKERSGPPFGYLAVVQNLDQEVKDYRNARFYLALVVIAFLVLAAAILHYSFRIMLKAIEEGKRNLSQQQLTDTLTGLPNRDALLERMGSGFSGMVILINIDRFKEVNEVFGITAGDHLLREYAAYLKYYINMLEGMYPQIEGKAVLYRLGRDEFVILLEGDRELAEQTAEFISYKTDSELIDFQGIEISVSVSIGISDNMEKPLQSSDTALKVSRERKRAYMCFDESLEENHHPSNNFYWMNKVKQAIKDDRIIPYFQGIMDNKTGTVNKYECLIRLQETDGSIVSPGMFLPVIKKTKLYPELTKIMIEKSVRHFEGTSSSFSINLSTEDIMNKEIVRFIKDLLNRGSLKSGLVFEILETENIGNYEEVREFIREVKQLGCEIALDDFGTGYSNFTHLMNLDFDYLKIDGSLIQNIHRDEYTNRLVKSIVGFAKGMNIKTIGEFVSSQDIYDAVNKLGIDYSQGFFIAKPSADT